MSIWNKVALKNL